MLLSILLLVVLFSLLWFATERPKPVLITAVFLAPWGGLDIDVGVRLTAFRIAMVLLAMACLLRLIPRSSGKRFLRPSILFVALFIYAVIRSLLQTSLLPSAPFELSLGAGALRLPYARAILQILMFALELSPILVVPFILNKNLDILLVGRVYILSCVILAILGWFQLSCWYSVNWNPFPIGLLDSLRTGEVREGISSYEGIDLYRMNSFGGEPKNLAQSLAVALILLQTIQAYWRMTCGRSLSLIWAFLFLSMLLTLSTSGYVLWTVGTVLLWTFTAIIKIGHRRHISLFRSNNAQITLVVATLSVAVLLVWTTEFRKGINWLEVVEERTIGRDFIEDFDAATIDFLADQQWYIWAGVGLGNIHLYANDYLPDYAAKYAPQAAFVAKSGYLKLVSELGLVGLTLFLIWAGSEIWHLFRIEKLCHRLPDAVQVCHLAVAMAQFGTIIVACYLLRGGYIVMQTFLTLGLLVTLRREMSEL